MTDDSTRKSEVIQSGLPVPPPRIIKIHGATKDTVRELADKHGIDYELLPTPRACSSERTPPTATHPSTTSSSYSTSESTRYYRSSREYYYYDTTDDWLCWCWLCLPSRRSYYRRSYGYDRDAYQKSRNNSGACGGSSSDCDSSSDDAAGVIAIIALLLLVGVVIALLPEIIAISAVVIGLLESVVILLFDVVTLGIFHDELTRTRIAVYEASEEQMKAFYKDLASKKALPDIPGLHTSGYMWLRVGAFLLIPSLIGLALAFFFGSENRIWYWIPASMAGFSLLCIVLGYLAILKKSSQVKRATNLQIWW